MNFSLVEEQRLLQETLARFVQKEYSFETRRKIQALPEGYSREVWQQLADMGVLGLPLPEAHGGFNGGPIEVMLAMNAIGQCLLVEPYFATVIMGAGIVAAAGNDAQQQAILPAVAEGTLLLAFAHGEPASRYELACVETRAKQSGAGYVLDGVKAVVQHGGQADKLIVSARTSGAARDAAGISLFIVERAAKGVSVRDYRTIDGLRAADISFSGVKLGADALLGAAGGAFDAIEKVTDRGIAALCAEAVGAMEALNAQTLDYLKVRQQFGQPIGRFQALQHRAVDMMIHAEQSKSMAYLAAMRLDADDAGERRRAVSAAKVQIGRSSRAVSQSAIQLHGGMGVTNELAASHYAKRLTMVDFQLGDSEYHLDRFIAAGE